LVTHIVPGPPFVFGALLVILALMVATFIPESLGRGYGSKDALPADGGIHASDSDSGGGGDGMGGGGARRKRRKNGSIVSRWGND
jgi:hypothetical protein